MTRALVACRCVHYISQHVISDDVHALHECMDVLSIAYPYPSDGPAVMDQGRNHIDDQSHEVDDRAANTNVSQVSSGEGRIG